MTKMECTCRPTDIDHPSHGPVRPSGPVDPGYGVELPPVVDNGLPGDQPSVDNSLPRPTLPVDPGYGLPTPPNVWPNPPELGKPEHPIALPPLVPSHPIYRPPVSAEHPITLPPGAVWPPLPPSMPETILALVWIVGVGYRWAVLNAHVELPVAKPPVKPAHPDVKPPVSAAPPIAPTPSPKS